MKVMIVDDNATNIKLLRITLQTEGLDTVEAADGVEALELLESIEVDAIISDVLMPNMDGYRLCQEVRRSDHLARIPFIIYTSSYDSSSDERMAMRSGADKFVRRPSSTNEIIGAIEQAVILARSRHTKLLAPLEDYEAVKTYSVELVRKLEQKNEELAQAHSRVLGMHQTLLERSEELQQSEAKFRSIFDNILDVFYHTDMQGRIEMISPSIQRYGYSQEELIGANIRDLYADEGVRDQLESALKEKHSVEDFEVELKRRDGEPIIASCSERLLVDFQRHSTGIEGIWRDMTERKRLEAQLLQSQKLESIGRLAGGLAHDFNNLLTAILGYAELVTEECDLDSRGREYIAIVTGAADRAAHLTQQLLAFARRQIIEPRVVNLNDLIIGLDKILRRLIHENIELSVQAQEDLHYVRVDPGQIEQILVNLVVNARDAMPDGGRITVETQNILLDEGNSIETHGAPPGEYVMVVVSDTGSGMDEAVQLHIFEPFFTTKPIGRGTGLGLSTVYGIVKQAGGHIWLYSEEGVGTTFKICLPRTVDSASAVAPSTQQRASRGTETVLIVEDESMVRNLAVQTLRARGYTVIEAGNGEEALRLIRGRESAIALLVTDVIMPQMSGKELVNNLLELNPSLKVLYVSGYTENTIVSHGVLDVGLSFLSKPFSPAILADKVRDVLDSIDKSSVD